MIIMLAPIVDPNSIARDGAPDADGQDIAPFLARRKIGADTRRFVALIIVCL